MENSKLKISLLQQENSFIKSELPKKQQVIARNYSILIAINRWIKIEIITSNRKR